NLETMTIDKGMPPAALSAVIMVPGVEINDDETVQLPSFINAEPSIVLAPKRTVFGGTGVYRLTGIAQTNSANLGAQSLIVRRGRTSTMLSAGPGLIPPTDIDASRTSVKWTPVAAAVVHSIVWRDATQELLEITVWEAKQSAANVPTLVALPASGTLTARVQ